MHIKKGDVVVVLSGADKGKKGKVVRAMPKTGMVVVDGVNMKKKHQKSRREGKKGQIIEIAMPINASNVAPEGKSVKKAKK
jgi:large subunit ribosomal protein L24